MSHFAFAPADKMPFQRRRRLFRSYQDCIDQTFAISEFADPRFHKLVSVPGEPDQEWLVTTDGRTLRFPPHIEKALREARAWVETGEGTPPVIPNEEGRPERFDEPV